MVADPETGPVGTVGRHAVDTVRRAVSAGPRAESVRDVVQDWWRNQASRTCVTVRDDMREDSFHPLPGAPQHHFGFTESGQDPVRLRLKLLHGHPGHPLPLPLLQQASHR